MPAPTDLSPLLSGAPNFIYMGGHLTPGSRKARHSQLYCSEGFAQLTPEDPAVVHRLGIRLVCDLRSGKN